MKIKTVCEKTGLTDRTIRYYIEEGLISPSYTENYLGRKSFEFSDENISELNDIAVLRSFDFSIEEIRVILLTPESSPDIIKGAKERLEKNLLINEKKVSAMSLLNAEQSYTLSQLAMELSKPDELEVAQENISIGISKRIFAVAKGIGMFLVSWLPILIGLVIVFVNLIRYDNPIVNPVCIAIVILGFIPSIVNMFTSRIKALQKKRSKLIILGVCLLCIPLCTVFSVFAVKDCSHQWYDIAKEREESCSVEGLVIKKCDECRSIEIVTIPKLPHKEVIDCAVEATCANEGLTEGKHCSVCKEATVPQKATEKKAHRYIRTITEGNCLNGGSTYYECSGCGDNYISNIISPTENHTFVKNGELGYRCTVCDLKVCEYGNADGSHHSNYCSVQYYITGVIDPNNEVERTPVIHGYGKMPEATNGEFKVHPWFISEYTEEITSIVICENISTIASGAFSENLEGDLWQGNPLRSVKSFIVKNKYLKIDKNSPDVSGIKCDITYSK